MNLTYEHEGVIRTLDEETFLALVKGNRSEVLRALGVERAPMRATFVDVTLPDGSVGVGATVGMAMAMESTPGVEPGDGGSMRDLITPAITPARLRDDRLPATLEYPTYMDDASPPEPAP